VGWLTWYDARGPEVNQPRSPGGHVVPTVTADDNDRGFCMASMGGRVHTGSAP
jgi:hypothetical protein